MEGKDARVDHPAHYTWLKGLEVIDITRQLDFDRGNAVKYILRAGRKQEAGMEARQKAVEDIEKAIFYLNDYKTKILQDGQ